MSKDAKRSIGQKGEVDQKQRFTFDNAIVLRDRLRDANVGRVYEIRLRSAEQAVIKSHKYETVRTN